MENNNNTIDNSKDKKSAEEKAKATKFIFPQEAPRFDHKLFDQLIL